MSEFLKKVSNDMKALPTGVKLIALVIFLRTFGWGFVDPFFSIFVSQFSDQYAAVGSLISIMSITSLLVMLPLMRLADKMKDTVIMRDAEVLYIFSVLFYLLSALTLNIYLLIVALIFNGIGLPFIVVGAETYIRKYTKAEFQTQSFAFYTALSYLGWILGMLIGAYTVQYYGLKWMFLLVLPGSAAGLLVLSHIRERGLRSMIWGIRKYFHTGHDLQVLVDDFRSLNPRTFFFLVLSFLDGIIVMFSYIFIPLFAVSIHLDLRQVALLMAIMYLPFIFSFIISELTEGVKRMHVISVGLLIGGFAFVLLGFLTDSLWVAVLATMTSVSIATIRPAYNGMITRLTPRRILGEVTSINNVALRLGFVVGPVFSGVLADRFGIQSAFLLIAFFALTLSALAILFRGFEVFKTETSCENKPSSL